MTEEIHYFGRKVFEQEISGSFERYRILSNFVTKVETIEDFSKWLKKNNYYFDRKIGRWLQGILTKQQYLELIEKMKMNELQSEEIFIFVKKKFTEKHKQLKNQLFDINDRLPEYYFKDMYLTFDDKRGYEGILVPTIGMLEQLIVTINDTKKFSKWIKKNIQSEWFIEMIVRNLSIKDYRELKYNAKNNIEQSKEMFVKVSELAQQIYSERKLHDEKEVTKITKQQIKFDEIKYFIDRINNISQLENWIKIKGKTQRFQAVLLKYIDYKSLKKIIDDCERGSGLNRAAYFLVYSALLVEYDDLLKNGVKENEGEVQCSADRRDFAKLRKVR